MKTQSYNRKNLIPVLLIGMIITSIVWSCSLNDDDLTTIAVTDVTLDNSSITLAVSSTQTLSATVSPSSATNTAISWSSSDESVATVSEGTVTGISAGSATITVTTDDGSYTASCSVTVSESSVAVTGVALNESSISLIVSSTETLTATISPSDATNSAVSWSSSDEDVATVSDGTVTAVAEGSATITVTTDDGGYTATCSVTVSASSSSDCSAYSQSTGTNSVSGITYCSSSSDENAVLVSGGSFTLTNCILEKSGGDTEDSDGSSFYGINSALLATDNGTVTMTGGTITTDASGANAIVAYGGTVNVSDVEMTCSQNLSRGIHATGGGTINASNLTITTAGDNSSVIATDRGGGTVTVTDGSYDCSGTDCAVIYSTGTITVNNITGTSSQGEMGVIEGDNSITINNSELTSGAGSSSRGLFLYQSFSGDAGEGVNSKINVSGGSLTMTGDEAPLIEVATVVTGQVTLDGVTTTVPSGTLMLVDYNTRWETYGATGVLILSGDGTSYAGSIIVDSYSSSEVTVNEGVTWTGTYDADNSGISTSVAIDGGTWELDGDSNVDSITLTNNAVINKNGYTLTYTSLTNTSGNIND